MAESNTPILPEFVKKLGLEKGVDNLLKVLLAEVSQDLLSVENYTAIIARAMELVDSLQGITGTQKKETVIYLVDKIHNYIIKNADISEEVKNLTSIALSHSSISTVVETIIAITKHEFHINEKHISCLTNLAQSLTGLCGSKAKSSTTQIQKK